MILVIIETLRIIKTIADKIIRKEKMAEMFIKQENETFWDTPGDKIVATSDDFYVDLAVLQVIKDLDDQLIGLSSVSN